jgi:hypothetical protein
MTLLPSTWIHRFCYGEAPTADEPGCGARCPLMGPAPG